MTPSHLHIPSVKNRQGRLAFDPFSKTKAFCFVILDKLDTPMPTYFLTKYCVLCIYRPRISGFSPQDAARLYNIFYGLLPVVSCLNHIPGCSPEGVSIPTCFTHLHTHFSCHATVSLNLDVVPFY